MSEGTYHALEQSKKKKKEGRDKENDPTHRNINTIAIILIKFQTYIYAYNIETSSIQTIANLIPATALEGRHYNDLGIQIDQRHREVKYFAQGLMTNWKMSQD